MAHEVNRVRGSPADEPSFRAFDLNQNLDPTREMILSPDDLRACFVDDPPPREGPAFLGFDFGEATSSTAACAIWPATGRAEFFQAFGDVPSLVERQRRDSAPYVEMQRRGELVTYPGRIVRPEQFPGGPSGGTFRVPRGSGGGGLVQGFRSQRFPRPGGGPLAY